MELPADSLSIGRGSIIHTWRRRCEGVGQNSGYGHE